MSGFFSFDTENRQIIGEEQGCLPDLTYRERLMGFFTCVGLAIFIDLLSWGSLIGLLTGNPTRFALTYTFGNIIALCGTAFLVGPTRQVKSLCDKKRWLTSTIYLLSMAMTLVCAMVLQDPFLTLVFIII